MYKYGEFVSSSFLGDFSDVTYRTDWYIHAELDFASRTIIQITDFDVNCETGTFFEVKDWSEIFNRQLNPDTRFCNKNKPVYPFTVVHTKRIRFEIRLCGENCLLEGFTGYYRTTALANLSKIGR